VRAWLAGKQPGEQDRTRFACPVPRIEPAIGLVHRRASSGIDISDGLAADLGHIAAASNVCVEIDLERIPCVDGVTPIQAVASGEEYEIVATAPEMDTRQFSEEFGLDLTEIGRVVAGSAGVDLLEGGKRITAPAGFDHFRDK
jgi:thiamine-monophosphate kinase